MDNERLHTLFIELQNGQMDSFDEFYELTKRGVFSVSYQILKSQDEAENVLQETYLQFLKKLPTLKSDQSILGYLTPSIWRQFRKLKTIQDRMIR